LNNQSLGENTVNIPLEESVFKKTFAAYSVVLVGTREPDGSLDLAPKHMVTPLGWDNYFGFVCTEEHNTFQNVERTGEFTVSYPRPDQIVSVSLSAEPRGAEDEKPDLDQLDTIDASTIDGEFIRNAYIYLECSLETISQKFGDNQFIAGEILAQHVHEDVLRSSERDANELINENPILSYLHPGRYAEITDTHAFPFPKDFHR